MGTHPCNVKSHSLEKKRGRKTYLALNDIPKYLVLNNERKRNCLQNQAMQRMHWKKSGLEFKLEW
jgi:hypothetical protein